VPLTVEITTPDRRVLYEEDIDEVIAPGVEGQFAVLPKHAAFMTMLVPGELILRKKGEDTPFAVTGGYFEVRDDHVIVLADAAERADEIDIERAEAARRRAEERLRTRETTVDLARAEAALRRALIRLRVAQERRRRAGPPRPG
jgi:F-type H+-transporting ATPase subunit epsilon